MEDTKQYKVVNAGSRLKELRLSKGMSLRELGKLLGVSQTYVTDVEKGNRNISKFQIFDDICKIFNLNMDERLDYLSKVVVAKDDELFNLYLKEMGENNGD